MSDPIKIPNGNWLKAWLMPGTIIAVIVVAGGFLGGYSGRQAAEAVLQQRVLTLEAEEQRHRDDMDRLGDKYITLREFRERMDALQQERRNADDLLLERMKAISADVGKMRGGK
jgi:hypothetical protein